MPSCGDLYHHRLKQICECRDKLVRLVDLVDWESFDQEFGRCYRPFGRLWHDEACKGIGEEDLVRRITGPSGPTEHLKVQERTSMHKLFSLNSADGVHCQRHIASARRVRLTSYEGGDRPGGLDPCL
jgi:hypothetical protein